MMFECRRNGVAARVILCSPTRAIFTATLPLTRGWWWCVVSHAKNIEFRPSCSDGFISGWPAETYGWPAGVDDAQTRIEQLVRAYGKRRISALLSDFKDLEPD